MTESRAIPKLLMREHTFEVPLDHASPNGPTIRIFAREVVERERDQDNLPWMVYFQGGPGFGAPRPMDNSGWLKRVLEDYRVLLLDQRGTGRSTPINIQSLQRVGGAQDQFEFLCHFRADAIVHDAEWIRGQLLHDKQQWTAFGQSYGGWCITNYLSQAPQGLEAAILTGGLPPIHRTADEVYRATYPVVEQKNHRFYQRYPEDEERIQRIARHLTTRDVRLPMGDQLTLKRFQQLGLGFYRSSGYDTLHYLLENAFADDGPKDELNYAFLRAFEQQFAFDTNPIFAILHESIYAQQRATNWAAERVRAEYPQFDQSPDGRILLTGEMIYPWMFDDITQLAPFRDVAQRLARFEGWSQLYDLDVLGQNEVPVAAIIYYEDMCVAREFSLETAQSIDSTRVWITNEYEHNGIGVAGERILDKLIDMVHDDVNFAF
jgi:pimeloyl-ACP methyl ester carboxylesterase